MTLRFGKGTPIWGTVLVLRFGCSFLPGPVWSPGLASYVIVGRVAAYGNGFT